MSFKYTFNVDSNHPKDSSSLKVPIFESVWNYYSFGEENLKNSMPQGLEHNTRQPHHQQQNIAQWRNTGNI